MLDFLKAFSHRYTYSPLYNSYVLFGLAWGLPVPLFSFGVHLYALGHPWNSGALLGLIREHPIHLFFLLHPLLFGLVFGAFGTLRRLQEERLAEAERSKERTKMDGEMQMAREVQEQLLPRRVPVLKTLDYLGYSRAVLGVGGDYYDFLRLPGGAFCLSLGDVSGKGVSAALLMASLHSLLRSRLSLRDEPLDRVLEDINRLLCSMTEVSRYASVFCGIYEDDTRRLTYVNAGHHAPLLFRREGLETEHGKEPESTVFDALGVKTRVAPSPEETVESLDATGMVLGMFPHSAYLRKTVQMHPGDVLLVFSDGILETTHPELGEFGEARLRLAVAPHLDRSAEELTKIVLEAVDQFSNRAGSHDDLSLIVARVR